MQVIDYLAHIKSLNSWYKEAEVTKDRLLVVGLNGSLKVVALEELLLTKKKQLCVITANEFSARQLVDKWRNISKFPIHLFPVNDIFSAEMAISSKENLVDRINALDFLMNNEAGAVVITVASARHLFSNKKIWQENHLRFDMESTYDLEEIAFKLVKMGYFRTEQVEKPGDFSIRGGIVDIYPLTFENPVRIDFFDDEIDSIRYFDLASQKSLENIEETYISPATDMIISSEDYENAASKIAVDLEKAYAANKLELSKVLDNIYNKWSQKIATDQDKFYIEYLLNNKATIFDYFNDDMYYIVDDYGKINDANRGLEQDIAEWQVQKLEENQMISELQVVDDKFHQKIVKLKNVTFLSVLQKGMGNLQFKKIINVHYQQMTNFFSQMPLLKMECERFVKQNYTVLFLVSNEEKRQKLKEILDELEINVVLTEDDKVLENEVQIINFPILDGFELTEEKIAVITEKEIFNSVTVKKRRKHREKLSNAERIKSYNELKVGDYVVHVNHGIGKYLGMETIEVDGNHQDYITILYKNDDKLFIPVTQLDLVQKYVAQDGTVPKINKLGGSEWHKTRQKAAAKIEDIADELLELYAKRESREGFAFSKDNDMQKMFEEAFPYVETEDQLRSTKEIKKDMEKARPMDRLLVGDVGYGKTEVALRAVFKAVQDNKQVVFLVPTTILAEQHYETMLKRFADFPVNVGVLNRFKTKKEQNQILSDLKEGKLDVVVGTHRVLSSDVIFKDLGLLVIDEEQRFGVKHKERLKQLKSQVDVLTLTATPIPRTLHMSMIGVRDLSVLETPPKDRYPVQTYVLERHFGTIKEAIEREMARDGQVFYLFNRVDQLESKVQELKQIVPDARIAYAHGQMTEQQLEGILIEFLEGEYDVLVTTTIIETGVDMPNVNTIFVDQADRMGLSQLYQLRGRVGRSNRIAYAYFMYEPMKVLSEVSEQRLEAIKEFTDLGSGFKIAMRDLSLRGAGNLLGASQHGFMNSIGFDLYTQMLEEAIMKKRGQTKEKQIETSININIDAYLPTTYINDQRQKIEIYKRLKETTNIEEIDELEEELLDRFGEYPKEVSYLLSLTRIKIEASKCSISDISLKQQKLIVKFTKDISKLYNPENYMNALNATKLKVRFNTSKDYMELQFLIKDMKVESWMYEIEEFIKALQKEYEGLVSEDG